MPGPCAKAVVTCTITALGGEKFVGSNWCERPQERCPRLPGEGYAKCASVCGQSGHAEIDALRLAGGHAYYGTAEVRGHTYACRECQEALFGAGIISLRVRP